MSDDMTASQIIDEIFRGNSPGTNDHIAQLEGNATSDGHIAQLEGNATSDGYQKLASHMQARYVQTLPIIYQLTQEAYGLVDKINELTN